MATSTANIVSSLNAGSGVDIQALAQNLVDAEKAPRADRIQAKIDQSNARISGYGAVSFALDTLKSAFDKLRDVSDFSSITASNSQPTSDGRPRLAAFLERTRQLAAGGEARPS